MKKENFSANKSSIQEEDNDDRDENESVAAGKDTKFANNENDDGIKKKDNHVNVIDNEHNELAKTATTNESVNNQTADGENNKEIQTLHVDMPAYSKTTDGSVTSSNQDEEEEDSALIETAFERPYSAPLAPLDVELMERLNKERELKRRSSSASKRRENRSSWARKSVDSTKIAATMFMEREQSNTERGRCAPQLNEFRTIVDVQNPADRDSQSQQQLTSMTNTNER